MERRMMIWLLCPTLLLLHTADTLITYIALTSSTVFREISPLFAYLLSKYGVSLLSFLLSFLLTVIYVVGVAVLGTHSRTQRWFELPSYWGLSLCCIMEAVAVIWNITLLIVGAWRGDVMI